MRQFRKYPIEASSYNMQFGKYLTIRDLSYTYALLDTFNDFNIVANDSIGSLGIFGLTDIPDEYMDIPVIVIRPQSNKVLEIVIDNPERWS